MYKSSAGGSRLPRLFEKECFVWRGSEIEDGSPAERRKVAHRLTALPVHAIELSFLWWRKKGRKKERCLNRGATTRDTVECVLCSFAASGAYLSWTILMSGVIERQLVVCPPGKHHKSERQAKQAVKREQAPHARGPSLRSTFQLSPWSIVCEWPRWLDCWLQALVAFPWVAKGQSGCRIHL